MLLYAHARIRSFPRDFLNNYFYFYWRSFKARSSKHAYYIRSSCGIYNRFVRNGYKYYCNNTCLRDRYNILHEKKKIRVGV